MGHALAVRTLPTARRSYETWGLRMGGELAASASPPCAGPQPASTGRLGDGAGRTGETATIAVHRPDCREPIRQFGDVWLAAHRTNAPGPCALCGQASGAGGLVARPSRPASRRTWPEYQRRRAAGRITARGPCRSAGRRRPVRRATYPTRWWISVAFRELSHPNTAANPAVGCRRWHRVAPGRLTDRGLLLQMFPRFPGGTRCTRADLPGRPSTRPTRPRSARSTPGRARFAPATPGESRDRRGLPTLQRSRRAVVMHARHDHGSAE